MSAELAGKTIAVTTQKSLNTDEIVELARSVFGATGCPRCTSGAFFTLREEAELPLGTATLAKAMMSWP